MKNLLLIIISVFTFSLSSNSVKAQSERDQIEVQVDGLGCPFCAYGLEKKFKEFKGIKDVKIEMETGQFTFTYPSEKAMTLEQVENQVDKAGYITELTEESEIVNKDIFVAGNCGMCKARIEKTAKRSI